MQYNNNNNMNNNNIMNNNINNNNNNTNTNIQTANRIPHTASLKLQMQTCSA